MLQSLYIQNYALIERLDISFEAGFSVITGETGAGKSIILGALGLLLGQRADMRAVRQGESKCVVEASFDVSAHALQPFFEENDLEYDDSCVVRREVLVSGKSRAFVNDTPVPLTTLKALGNYLVDIHSQHQNLLLSTEGYQLHVLDALAGNAPLRARYAGLYNDWTEALRALHTLQETAAKNKADEDYVRFQWEQLAEARLTDGEQETLEQEGRTLEHAEEIKEGLFRCSQLLDGADASILRQVGECRQTLQAVAKVFPACAEMAGRVESAYIELKDLSREVESMADETDFDPKRQEEVTGRLNLIYSLQQKHHADSVRRLLELQESYRSRLEAITSSDGEVEALERRCARLLEQLREQACELTRTRALAADKVEREMHSRLALLGMPHVRFKVEVEQRQEPGREGADAVRFLFTANKNGALQDIASVASGGEIARIMLSVKAMIAQEVRLPAIIFDEIDTGVSGEIAARMATMMQEMSGKGCQVISITHLPQIAAQGKAHYKVFKEDNESRTVSSIRRLGQRERVEEIAHMLSGTTLTAAAMENARELLDNQRNNV